MLSKAAQLSEHYRKTRPSSLKSLSHRGMIFGVGVNDAPYEVRSGKHGCPAYRQWKAIIQRCYSAIDLEKRPTYHGCHVEKEWHSFMAFRSWWVVNHVDGYQIDKDLLALGSKVYGSEYCLFVPNKINAFMTDSGSARGCLPIGVYLDRSRGKFSALCCDGNGAQIKLGRFDCPSLAHMAWQKYKLARLEDLRAEMDAIDPRIYANAKAKILSYAEGLNL